MSQDRSKLLSLREDVLTNRLNRRDVLKRATVLGLSAPVIASLLAACGDDEEDEPAEATEPATSADPTEAPEEEPTEEMTEETPQGEETPEMEPTPEDEETPEMEMTPEGEETPDAEGTPEDAGSGEGEIIDGGDRLMGYEMEEGTPGGVMVEASFTDISTTNPIFSGDTASAAFLSMVFESLFEANPDTLEPVGNLATSWMTNEDATVWTVMLREDATWHDGEVFTAEDVKFTFDTHLNEAVGSPRTSEVAGKIESVEIVDDLTVQFNLLSTLVDFPLDLGVYDIVAEHIWGSVDPVSMVNDPGSNGEDASRIVGTGPFIFDEWVDLDYVSCVRNDNYWDGAPYLDQFIIRVVTDQAAGVAQLQTGEVDLGSVPEVSVSDLEGSDITVSDFPTLGFTFYGTNLDPERTTLFQEVEVRKALFHAINRPALIESVRFGYGEVAIGSMPVLSWAYNPQGIEEPYDYNPELSMQLLDEAGWIPGADGIREKDGQRMSFQMNTNAGDQVREAYLVAFQEFWAQIGVEMMPNIVPGPQLVEQIIETFDFDVFMVGFFWSATPDQASLFSCDAYGAGFNGVKYCNPEVDALLEEALVATDQEERIQLYTDFQNVMLADLPMPIIDFPRRILGVNNRVHNFVPNSVNLRFNSEQWWVEQ